MRSYQFEVRTGGAEEDRFTEEGLYIAENSEVAKMVVEGEDAEVTSSTDEVQQQTGCKRVFPTS